MKNIVATVRRISPDKKHFGLEHTKLIEIGGVFLIVLEQCNLQYGLIM